MNDTRQVLAHHLECFAQRDLEGILADYTDRSLLLTPEGTLEGRSAIRPLLARLCAEFSKPGASLSMKVHSIAGELGFLVWSAETAENRYEFATDTFVVREGKIAYQSFAARILPRG